MLVLVMCLGIGVSLVACNEECKHVWNEGELTVEPSESAPGKKVFTCTVCGQTMTEDIPFVTAGEHEHAYGPDWAKNEVYHWHACTAEGCTEGSDKAEHEWGVPTISKEATDDADGELTFACTVCAAERVETYKKEGISEDEWNTAIADQKFDNVTVYYTLEDASHNSEQLVMITEADVYRKAISTLKNGEISKAEKVFTGEEAQMQRDLFLGVFLALLAEKDNYVYDPVEKIYNAPEEVSARIERSETYYVIETLKGGKVKFGADGKLEYFTGELTETLYSEEGSEGYTYDMTVTFSDYGTTVVDENTSDGMSEEEWNAAIADERFDNVTLYYTFDSGVSTIDQQVKIANGNVYRRAVLTLGSGVNDIQEEYFTGDEAKYQRDMFTEIFIALLESRENYDFNIYTEKYFSDKEITASITHADGTTTKVTIRNAEVIMYMYDGNISSFKGALTQETYDADGELKNTMTGDVQWSFSAYGNTEVNLPAES